MRKTFIVVFCLLLIGLFPILSSAASSVPYKTETLSADGNVIETQTAYVPIGIFENDAEIVSPEHVFIDDHDYIYIADSGTQLVTKFDEQGNELLKFGEGLLEQPQGVFVSHENHVYVADYAAEKVFRFSEDGELLKEYARPDSPLFGKRTTFKPQKISVDLRGNLYIISEGSTNGIIQMNQDGSFLGFYGVNNSRPSILTFLQDLITTESQKASLFMKVPPAPTNIAIDEKGLIYTITSGTDWEVIRKLNIAGANMLPSDLTDVTNLRDISIGHIGNIYTIGNDGKIYEYDRFGNLLFIFGGKEDESNRNGLFMQPSSIEVDNLGRLYIADKEKGTIQVFEPTDFTAKLHEGLALYAEGFYVESQDNWTEILNLNSSFGLAHTAMGQAFYKQQLYDEALAEFILAENKAGYSDAYWEIRQRWMQENLSKVFVILVGFFILWSAVKFADKKKGVLQPARDAWTKVKSKKLVSELLFILKFIKHPIDSFYYVKRTNTVSVLSATILYFVLFIEYLLTIYWTGFLFSDRNLNDINLFMEMATLFVPIFLFIVANYLVSTITDGEGRFRDIYIGTIYSLVPVILYLVPITIVSNALTINESFVYTFSMQIIIVWSAVILFIMIQEIHNFTFFETVRNILVTIFAMLIIILVFFVIYVLLDQVIEFVLSIIQEVILRV
ncbi:YIP1 family protein [Sutcliffiella sp. NC1]|uniref:YIP1 family protein n=1 Tax=Sutcliffiella sp. NC1 TaxID=3004096 RepID=UPI0022DE1C02|nr:YIP1 family protein [Sutcliffiella sp. NC1]WBL14660.1 SMP-30/gluconolactonase/LRE family protein [Sutcliffiella sp. NC1]